MPALDGTGPQGQGPMTGRGMGFCGAGTGRGFGRGFGNRLGRGAGMGIRLGCCPYQNSNANLSKEDEKKILEAELKEIEAEKEAVAKRLKELK